MTRYLVTGANGFVGSYLVEALVGKGSEVHCLTYQDPSSINHLRRSAAFRELDLRDEHAVREVVAALRPQVLFHLAAQSFVSVSWEDPKETLDTNVMGTFYLLESLRGLGEMCTVVLVGSSSIYGPCRPDDMPLREDSSLRPTSMYAVSKATEDLLGHFYWRVYGMRVVRVRPFNMTGPGKTGDACSDFARGIAEIENGLRDELLVGNLDTVRDFTDGRDATQALWILAEKGEPGEIYNLASGRGYRMRDILERCIALTRTPVKYRVVPERLRPFDDPIYVGDSMKLQALGWHPQIPIEQTLKDMLDYWRLRLTQSH